MRFTIRQMMILIVFLSIPLAALAYGRRLSGREREIFALFAGFPIWLILIGLTALIIRPGPWRTLLGRFFYIIMVVNVVVMLLITMVEGSHILTRSLFVDILIRLPMVAPNLLLLLALIWDAVPRVCPICQRRCLLPSKVWVFFSYPSEGPGRPRYRFRWCGHCGARLKTRRLGWFKYEGWKEASALVDIKQFSLWTPGSRAPASATGTRSINPTDPRNDPAVERVE
jgi:hypothetical protein